jgi:hypothetical protein
MGGRAHNYVVGAFNTKSAADVALHRAFLKAQDTYLVDDLTDDKECDPDNSYYIEGKEFSIDYKFCGEVQGEVFGEITEVETNTENLSLDIEED